MLLRTLSITSIMMTLLLTGLILLMPNFAPRTAALSYYEITPERQQAIYLRDVNRGVSTFTGFATYPGPYVNWSTDGQRIISINQSGNPTTTLDILELSTRTVDHYELEFLHNHLFWARHDDKFIYFSAWQNGSLRLQNRATDEDTLLMRDVDIHVLVNLPEPNLFLLSLSPQAIPPQMMGETHLSGFYIVDLDTETVTLLKEHPAIAHFEVLGTEVIYSEDNQLMAFSIHVPEESRVLATFGNMISSFSLIPPESRQLQVATLDGELWHVNIDGSGQELFMEVAPSAFTWTSNGEAFAFLAQASRESSTIRVIRDNEESETTINARVSHLFWSPDGRYLIAPSPVDTYVTEVYLVDTLTQTTEIVERVYVPLLWQPEGD